MELKNILKGFLKVEKGQKFYEVEIKNEKDEKIGKFL